MTVPPHLLGTYYPTEASKKDAKPLTVSAGAQKGYVKLECDSETWHGKHSVEVLVQPFSGQTYNLVGPSDEPMLTYDASMDLIGGAVNCDWETQGLEVSFKLKIVNDNLRCFFDSYPAKYTNGKSVPPYPSKDNRQFPKTATEYCLPGTPADDRGNCPILMIKGYTLRLSFGMDDDADFVFSTDPHHPWIVWTPEPKNFYTSDNANNAVCIEKDLVDKGADTYSFALWVRRNNGTFLKTDPTIVNRADPGPPTLGRTISPF